MKTIVDQKARELATNPHESVLVRAPAGSGKTSLMIQRLQNLLRQGYHPQHILLLTFTRKATEEIKSRAISALSADAALQQRAQERGWPAWQHCLQIQTYDEWILSHLRRIQMTRQVHPQPSCLYDEAARRFLQQDLEGEGQLFSTLTQKRWRAASTLHSMLCHLLAKREHWLAKLHQGDHGQDQQWQRLNEHLLHLLNEAFAPWQNTLCLVMDHCQEQRGDLDDLRSPCCRWDIDCWRRFSHWLLTQGDVPRSPNRQQGFANKSMKVAGSEMAKEQYKHFTGWLGKHPEKLILLQLLHAPTDTHNDLTAIMETLPQLTAHLYCVMQETGHCDHTQNTLDLLTRLQNQSLSISQQTHHLLLDEFQDTSPVQYLLLGYLCQEWSQDGHFSVFIVGDPMQAIYSFRDADLSLFMHLISSQSFHNHPLHVVHLEMNFRSSPSIVDFCNRSFQAIMNPHSMIQCAMLPHQNSHAYQSCSGQATWLPCDSREEQLHHLAELCQEKTTILVRSHQQGQWIAQYFNQQAMPLHNHLANLSDQPLYYDLTCLFAALQNPNDGLSWLSLARSAWLRLDLSDYQGQNPRDYLLNLPETKLSWQWPFLTTLKDTLDQGLATWDCFGRLASQLIDPEDTHLPLFLNYLYSEYGRQTPLPTLLARLARLRLDSQPSNDQSELMTMHQAKGLEFDHVILPFADEYPQNTDSELLRWGSWHASHHSLPISLMALADKQDSRSHFLKCLQSCQKREENKRLLYVACSRAKRRLTLLGNQEAKRESLLGYLQAHDQLQRLKQAKACDSLIDH